MRRVSRSAVIETLLVVIVASIRLAFELGRGRVHAGDDLGEFFIPNFVWWWQKARWLGGWNPWIFGGYPARADSQLAMFHPFGALYAGLPPLTASAIEGALSPALGGVGMLAYLRSIRCGRVARLLGAISFALGGVVTAHAPHPGVIRSAIAIPWALAAIEGCDGFALSAALGASSAAVMLGGHPQIAGYALLLIGIYAVVLGRMRTRRRWLFIGAGLLLGFGIGAGTWLPTIPLMRASTRTSGTGPDPWRLGWQQLAMLIAPFARGGSTGLLYGEAHPPALGIVETTGYPGMLVVLLIAIGTYRALDDARVRFWVAIAVVSLVLATGPSTAWLPFPGLRVPARILLWWNLAAASLSALVISADAWRGEGQYARRWWVVCAVFAALIVSSMAFPHASPRAAIASLFVLAMSVGALRIGRSIRRGGELLLVVLTLDLVTFAVSMPLGITESEWHDLRGVVEMLRETRSSAGLATIDRSLMFPVLFGANWAPFSQVALLQGYNPLVLRSVANLLGEVPYATGAAELGRVEDASLATDRSLVLDLLRGGLIATGARGALSQEVARSLGEGGDRWQPLSSAAYPEVRFYVNRRVLPLAWFVERARVVPPQVALRLVRGELAGDEFDPRIEALTTKPIPSLEVTGTADRAERGSVETISYLDDEITLRVHRSRSGLLVTSEIAFPGWTCAIDGIAQRIRTVDYAFRAVVVPGGSHMVVFRYRPRFARLGLAITSLSAAMLAMAAIRALRTRKARGAVA